MPLAANSRIPHRTGWNYRFSESTSWEFIYFCFSLMILRWLLGQKACITLNLNIQYQIVFQSVTHPLVNCKGLCCFIFLLTPGNTFLDFWQYMVRKIKNCIILRVEYISRYLFIIWFFFFKCILMSRLLFYSMFMFFFIYSLSFLKIILN